MRSATLACLVLGASVTSQAFAAPSYGGVDLSLSMTSYQLGRLSGSETGEKSAAGTSFYHLGLQGHLPFFKGSVMLSPVVRYMPESLHAVDAPEDGSRTSMALVELPLVKTLGPSAFVGAGVGMMRYAIAGKGGDKEMPNGQSTATFALPERKVETTTLYTSLVGGLVLGRVVGGLEILIHDTFSSDKRALSGLVSCGYRVWSL